MALPPTPFDIFGPTPFNGQELLGGAPPPLPGLAGEMFAGANTMQAPMGNLLDIAAQQSKPEPDPAIAKLKPGSDLHGTVLAKLDAMYNFSAGAMRNNYARWNFMERKTQAFVNDQDYQELLDSLKTKNVLPPEPLQVVVPYTYATLHAAATYISSVLLGRKPVFQLSATRGTEVEKARYMEQALQYNLDESMGQEVLWQQIWDGLNYSFACTRLSWEEQYGPRMRLQAGQRLFEDSLLYAGNRLTAVDPYKCFPDPRVPLHQCPKKGDFLFTAMDISETTLRAMSKGDNPVLRYVEEALKMKVRGQNVEKPSDRRVRIGQGNHQLITPSNVVGFREVLEGTVRLVPKDWGLGDKDMPELWKFVWFKGKQILQAEPLNMLHDQHPYALQEPNSTGYDFMSLSLGEMITVFQDVLSWLVSSRMENVRAAIHNTFIADPARVELNDIRSSTIGRVIRLKQAAMGLPIDQAIKQLAVSDVTGGHLSDIQVMRMLADSTTGVNDNLRGIQTQGGRRSATEARMSMQAGASRLSQMAVRISAQQFNPAAQQMIMNVQQFMPAEMWIEMTGDKGMGQSLALTPDMLAGSYNFSVSDGSLPVDKLALTEVWKEILFGIARDPELRQRFSMVEIFKYVAELGGAKNIDSFENPPLPPQLPQIADPGVTPEGTPIGAAQPPMPAGIM